MKTYHIHITGIVQGVGFRPFVYGLATRFELYGWVCNTSAGVDIEVQGKEENLGAFISALRDEKPLLAKIDSLEATEIDTSILHHTFNIRESATIAGAFQPVSADVAICADCERELFDPNDRRYLYPFINCTNCGPRFTIIKDLPYDRPKTTMASFPLCPDCTDEYHNPLDRRFHAQPVACPVCGPHVWVEQIDGSEQITGLQAILLVRRLLRQGKIVAIKGLGGFHLACDAANPSSVELLRQRKGRQGKPLALMAADMASIESLCHIRDEERLLLTGYEKPIILLERLSADLPSEQVAPGVDTLGIMLPYTPLHLLLLNQTNPLLAQEPVPPVLVMTSGNFSEEPIATQNRHAIQYLAPLADAFLLHNRDIHIRCDDSVIRLDRKPNKSEASPDIIYLRRSRGYAPYPIHLPFKTRPTLALGGDLKNSFCLTRQKYAFLSHHIGDMENVETHASFEQGIDHLCRLFRVEPEQIACDLHPGYFTTSWAQDNAKVPLAAVQHHHAHIAACMADNGLENQRVIGLAFDGTGYGYDGAIWGGEVLLADYTADQRIAHLEYLPLPGGEAAIHHPWRIAVGYAATLGLDVSHLPFLQNIDQQAIGIVRAQVEKRINTPLTSSMGRLFDAVASLVGVRNDVTYEAQAAIELETLSRSQVKQAAPYPYTLIDEPDVLIIGVKPLFTTIIEAVSAGQSPGWIGACFHYTIADLSLEICRRMRERTHINSVALSGGVWQNQLLLELTRSSLTEDGFRVYFHHQTPTNDGGLALGQAAVANHRYQMLQFEQKFNG
ncbi:MAG: carbamoyltransferase HypF [Anaerolineales bacterium]|nr:carbamoyltransferase HypF [Anaerolineales bacterium]